MNLKIDTVALNRRRRRFLPAVQYVMSIKDSVGCMLVSAFVSTVYAA
jgi:hypothetical protein